MLFGRPTVGQYRAPAELIPMSDGQRLEIAGMLIDILHTPGHTPGHVCLHFAAEGVLFSGDHLFAGSIGRTDLPGGDYDALMDSMERRIRPLAPETVVYPGHGPATTLAEEFRSNPFLFGL
jgi:glyoxylase-like metal-dependent hydrolase (beta-lactamase superfamily II)